MVPAAGFNPIEQTIKRLFQFNSETGLESNNLDLTCHDLLLTESVKLSLALLWLILLIKSIGQSLELTITV